ncbi:MAG: LytR/AlgR family response regulator transcription factor [Clostridium chrysemydis]|uniref:LytR/AlgR family response regulator transcription factor n=1 Tax=Clostridium chrysemydis TaxID=2665504 RepID=UPI003F2AB3AC
MFNIFICEDNKEQLDKIHKIIYNTILIENYDMEITLATKNPSELLEYLKSNKIKLGIYFLDIDLSSEINGIQLAEEIRKNDPSGLIIFVTTHAEMSFLTFKYKIEAMDYIIKDNFEDLRNRIKECLIYANKKYSKETSPDKIFSLRVEDKIMNINHNDIIYFETSKTIHRIIAHCKDRQIEFYGKMKNLELELKEYDFCRCHTSYIINKKKVIEINRKDRVALMNNGDECLISVRGIKLLIK